MPFYDCQVGTNYVRKKSYDCQVGTSQMRTKSDDCPAETRPCSPFL